MNRIAIPWRGRILSALCCSSVTLLPLNVRSVTLLQPVGGVGTTGRRSRAAVVIAIIAALAFVTSACSGGGSLAEGANSGTAGASGNGTLKPFKVGYVPALGTLPYQYALAQGFYRQVGLDVTLSPVDSGPAINAGVINGSYDAGWTALFPVLIAADKGAQLKVIMNNDSIEPGLKISSVVVKSDSPIRSYKDLDGKTVATNALTSLTTLATKIGVDKAGGDAKSVKFISLPFKSAVQAADRGQADAAVVIQPFGLEAQASGMRVIGDPIGDMMPKGSADAIVFTSATTATAKKSEIDAFRKASEKAMQALNENPSLVRQLAQSDAGLSASVAQQVGLLDYTGTMNIDPTQQYADLAAKYGYTAKPVDVRSLLLP